MRFTGSTLTHILGILVIRGWAVGDFGPAACSHYCKEIKCENDCSIDSCLLGCHNFRSALFCSLTLYVHQFIGNTQCLIASFLQRRIIQWEWVFWGMPQYKWVWRQATISRPMRFRMFKGRKSFLDTTIWIPFFFSTAKRRNTKRVSLVMNPALLTYFFNLSKNAVLSIWRAPRPGWGRSLLKEWSAKHLIHSSET